ncbi:hypothetical protein GCM10010203_17060 [Actinomadura yumaensis]|jgi:hypothetical protein|uniref:hypothetical protein n=1 Tax=Brevundimonas aurantiaca TaxID=74316 RepID=UPI0015FFD697
MNGLQHNGITATHALKAQGMFSGHDNRQYHVVHVTPASFYMANTGEHDRIDFSSGCMRNVHFAPTVQVSFNSEKKYKQKVLNLTPNVERRVVHGGHVWRPTLDLPHHLVPLEASIIEPTAHSVGAAVYSDASRPAVIDEVVSLVSGWDGEGSIAPTSEGKRSTVEIAAILGKFIDSAEVEVDPSDGGVALRWFSNSERALVSIDIRPTGKAVVVGTNVGGKSSRKMLAPNELHRVLRTAVDAGLTRLDDNVR